MQAPRNWRMKIERYRLIGTANSEGDTSIVNRPQSLAKRSESDVDEQSDIVKVTAA